MDLDLSSPPLDHRIERLLSERGIDAEPCRFEILRLDPHKKLTLLEMARVKIKSSSPVEFVETLSSRPSVPLSFLRTLRVCLTNEPEAWGVQFLDRGGLIQLESHTARVTSKPAKNKHDWGFLREMVDLIKVMLTNQYCWMALRSHEDGIAYRLIRLAFSHNLDSPPVLLPVSEIATSPFASSKTVPPVDLRRAALELALAMMNVPTGGWEYATRALACERGGFLAWLHELETCVADRARLWSGNQRKASDVFNSLADGTYRWQPIVQAPPQPVTDQTAVEYVVSHLKLIVALHLNQPHWISSNEAAIRQTLTEGRLDKILDRLSVATVGSIQQLVLQIKLLHEPDDQRSQSTPPSTEITPMLE